jgi:YD repeat-containing protein
MPGKKGKACPARGDGPAAEVLGSQAYTYYYDELDRVVMVKDGKGLKTFTKYDALGRVVMTGKYYGTEEPSSSEDLFETPDTAAPHYYTTDRSFPDDGLIDVLTVNY